MFATNGYSGPAFPWLQRRVVPFDAYMIATEPLPASVLDAVLPDWQPAAEEPERRALLEVHPRYVRFRHELARNAIGGDPDRDVAPLRSAR